jgi:hypothetical protein
MMLFLIVFIFLALAMLGMAIGLIVNGTPLRGSCGRDCSCKRRQ